MSPAVCWPPVRVLYTRVLAEGTLHTGLVSQVASGNRACLSSTRLLFIRWYLASIQLESYRYYQV